MNAYMCGEITVPLRIDVHSLHHIMQLRLLVLLHHVADYSAST